MKIFDLISKSLIFICIIVSSCNPNVKERTKQANEDSTKPLTEKEQKDEIRWINDIHGYFIDSRDSKRYKVVKIGTQIWFAENLAYQPAIGDFWAFNNDPGNISKYGYLYFWETANTACPFGWHLPSYEEWDALINFLGGKHVAGEKLKSTTDWNSSNKGATNSCGLSILPGGNRAVGGNFYHLGDDALLWTGTAKSDKSAWKIRINYNADSIGFEACSRQTGLSVRCIKD